MYRIVGKVVHVDLDGEGNVHLVLRSSDRFWSEVATRYLRGLRGQVVSVEVKRWRT